MCTLSLPSWKGATGKVSPQVLQPRCPRLKQYQNSHLKLLLETSGLETPFISALAIFTISSRGGQWWEQVLKGQEKRAEILSYLRDSVDIHSFFAPYKGDFQGKFYDSPIPPSACFPNSKSRQEFTDFISSTISQRLANGSISVWGKVGECTPPYLVMPLTVEPTKPRLCHDERFLNLWVKDSPFTLDYISNLPRYVGKDSFQTTIDDKSGYDHVRLVENSRKFLGLQWQGVYYLYRTIPFG